MDVRIIGDCGHDQSDFGAHARGMLDDTGDRAVELQVRECAVCALDLARSLPIIRLVERLVTETALESEVCRRRRGPWWRTRSSGGHRLWR